MRTRNPQITAALGVVLFATCAAQVANADPRVISAGLDRPAVTGAETGVVVQAVDPSAPVSGMSVAFGSEVFALSACRPTGSDGRPATGPFAAGAPVALRAPHSFPDAGPQSVVARIDSGGCGTQGGTIYQPLTVTPTRPGETPITPVLGTPVTLPSLLPTGTGLPGGVDLPGPSPLATASAGCPGAARRVGRGRRARSRARRKLLCVMNAVRRRAGLAALRENGRLRRAAVAHSGSMVRRHYFSHVAPGGVVLNARLRRTGYLPARRWLVGENLASGRGRKAAPLSIVRGWLASAPHRANLMEGSFREVGLGVVAGQPRGRGGTTYTANFGLRR